jgi:hypothetical protein
MTGQNERRNGLPLSGLMPGGHKKLDVLIGTIPTNIGNITRGEFIAFTHEGNFLGRDRSQASWPDPVIQQLYFPWLYSVSVYNLLFGPIRYCNHPLGTSRGPVAKPAVKNVRVASEPDRGLDLLDAIVDGHKEFPRWQRRPKMIDAMKDRPGMMFPHVTRHAIVPVEVRSEIAANLLPVHKHESFRCHETAKMRHMARESPPPVDRCRGAFECFDQQAQIYGEATGSVT